MRTLTLVDPRCGVIHNESGWYWRGAGGLMHVAPEFLGVGDDGTVIMVSTHPGEKSRGDVSAAVDSGPVLALAPHD
jgi:hypothetical protein